MPLNREQPIRDREIFDDEDPFRDERDSMIPVGTSLLLFGALEYGIEVYIDSLPGGLMLPLGFLLYWAFYYTYYQPNRLDDRLQPLSQLNIPSVFGMIFGVAVWFVKVTVVGLFDLVFVRWWRPAPAAAKARPRPQAARENTGSYRFHQNTGSYRSYRPSSEGPKASPPPGARPTAPHPLPLEMLQALAVLGLNEGVPAWDSIHKRYRELAKRYHPDLNQEITRAGNRFIKVDQAYRKLSEGKGKFFK